MNPNSRTVLKLRRRLLHQAMDRGDIIPKDPKQVQATPPSQIGLTPRERRLILLRQRAFAMRTDND